MKSNKAPETKTTARLLLKVGTWIIMFIPSLFNPPYTKPWFNGGDEKRLIIPCSAQHKEIKNNTG